MPASTLTNVGLTGNGRSAEYLLTILFSSNLEEERILAKKIKQELESTIKSFVRRSDDKYGKALQDYLQNLRKTALKFTKKYARGDAPNTVLTRLVNYESEKNIYRELRVEFIQRGCERRSRRA